MSSLHDVGERDGWRCWLCDEAVDPDTSVNDDRGPSIDARTSAKAAKKAPVTERLAHRACNTRKGAVTAVVPWPTDLFVSDPAPLVAVAERLERRGGREVVARCPSRSDAEQTAAWLRDRFTRLTPGLTIDTSIDPGGGQFMVGLLAR